MDQELLTNKILQRFKMDSCKPAPTPLPVGGHPNIDHEDNSDTDIGNAVPYKSAVGALQYLALSTRPDIAQAVNFVSRFASKPGAQNWRDVKRILRYVAGTRALGITFKRSPDPNAALLHGFADADWGGDLQQRRSTTGFIFKIAGGPVTWRSKLQATVALSTAEAEYLSAAEAAREALWLRSLLHDLGLPQDDATIIFDDNQGAIAMTVNSGLHQRTKHIDVRHHFIKQHVDEGRVILKYLPTEDMVADILTKPLAARRFIELRGALLNDTLR